MTEENETNDDIEMEMKAINAWTPTSAMTIREHFSLNIFQALVQNGNFNTYQAVYLAHDLIETLNAVPMQKKNF